jgi:hypothetical protein
MSTNRSGIPTSRSRRTAAASAASAAMYCAYTIPSRPASDVGFQTASRRLSLVSLTARIALPSDGSKFSRET